MTLALFDLDHTLLDGDSDVLWCNFLIRHGLLPPEQQALNAQMEAGYRDGSVTVAAFCSFYVSLTGGRSLDFWAPWCKRFLHDDVLPRIPPAAHALVDQHRRQGHTLLLTTATNRVITERTAQALGIPHLLATEVEVVDGVYTGRTQGVLNMRDGKVQRLHAWLAQQPEPPALAEAWFYSDSTNDLPLLSAVGHPVATNPDERLRAHAQALGWPVLRLFGDQA